MTHRVLEFLNADASSALARLSHFLSIPSISTDPACQPHILQTAQWLAQQLSDLALSVRILPTEGHPVVLAQTPSDQLLNPNAPRLLFYGHYDVQPPDPLDQWSSPPFQPTIRNNAIYARGASDDKGQLFAFLQALRAWHQTTGKFPGPLTILIEGEEEIGSVHLPAFLRQHASDLAADIVLISDTQMWNRHTPAITYGLRGLVYFDIQLHHADRDVHSGIYGGTFANPAQILVDILARLFDHHRRLTIPGFYDDVLDLSPQERAHWAQLNFNETDYLAQIGVKEPFGETGFDTLARRWARPACDINGLYSGWTGPGAKTIIPAFAGAKISFRLAPMQKSARIAQAFETWLRQQPTFGCRWKITPHGACDPVLLPLDSPYLALAARALEKAAGRPPVFIREGATIPVVAEFKNILGLDSLLVGFGLMDDCVHAPNEKFDLACLHLAWRSHALILAELANLS